MSHIKDYIEFYKPGHLEKMFPYGVLSEEDNGSRQVVEAIRSIENLILENENFNTLLARFSLLQAFPRQIKFSEELEDFFDDYDTYVSFVKEYALTLCPEAYREILEILSLDEIEIFLKNYLFGHEIWGSVEGMASMVRTMLESATHYAIPVNVAVKEKNVINIEDHHKSYLGKQHSTLGADFISGQRFLARPKYYSIDIGPIYYNTLEVLQEFGWADGFEASEKMKMLISVSEPYYLSSKVKFILATQGFELGKAKLGSDILGVAYTMKDD